MGIYRKLILSFILLATGSLISLGFIWVFEGNALSIRSIYVHSGAHAKPEELQLYLKEFIGKPLYGVDLKQVQEAAQKHPWVASASVRRQPPRELEVWVEERKPVALIKKERLWVVDALAVVFKAAESEEELSLPLVSEPEQVGVLVSHREALEPAGHISEVLEAGPGQYRILFVGGLEVVMGKQNSLQQWRKLISVLAALKERQNDLAFVYLDDTPKRGQIAIRFKKG